MSGAVAVLNSGPSSIRFSLHDLGSADARARGQMEAIHTAPRFVANDAGGFMLAEKSWPSGTPMGHAGALDYIVGYIRGALGGTPLAAIGHRVVHGGMLYDHPVRVDAQVLLQLEALIPLAPLQQPHNLTPMRILLKGAPGVPQIACFDTAFHRTQPEVAQMFGLPRAYHEQGVRRFGFHGLSCEYIASQLAAIDPAAARGRTVVLHLGNTASMCALLEGRSIASTMGFTAMEGLLMGTRCGALDPGVVLYLMESQRMEPRAVEKLLCQQSGLLGVSGVSSDMRTLLASPHPEARVAVDLYLYRIRRELGALAGVLGGVDAFVFTGGVGANSAAIRARVCADSAWLGVQLDANANDQGAALVTAPRSAVRAWRMRSDEDGIIARHTQRLTARQPVAVGHA